MLYVKCQGIFIGAVTFEYSNRKSRSKVQELSIFASVVLLDYLFILTKFFV